jgi:DNA-binding LacI/PurR family transcriptional regulator
VSNVSNSPALVSDATGARGEKAIAKLGSVRNQPARQLRAGRSRSIGMVVTLLSARALRPAQDDPNSAARHAPGRPSAVFAANDLLAIGLPRFFSEIEALDNDAQPEHQHIEFAPDLVVRRSTAPPRAG